MGNAIRYTIVGYGRMGGQVKEFLDKEGAPYNIIDPKKDKPWKVDSLKNTDVAICFTDPDAGYETTKQVLENGVNAVVGTTKFYTKEDGSLNKKMLDEFEKIAKQKGVVLVYAPNFSPGVNSFVKELEEEAPFYSEYGYQPDIIEVHHTGKTKDVSGTAVNLIGPVLLKYFEDKKGLSYDINKAIWPEEYDEDYTSALLDAPFDNTVKGESAKEIREQVASAEAEEMIPIVAIRTDNTDTYGRHRVNFVGKTDSVSKDSSVTDKRIFAKGAVDISKQVPDLKPGVYHIRDLI